MTRREEYDRWVDASKTAEAMFKLFHFNVGDMVRHRTVLPGSQRTVRRDGEVGLEPPAVWLVSRRQFDEFEGPVYVLERQNAERGFAAAYMAQEAMLEPVTPEEIARELDAVAEKFSRGKDHA